MTFSFDDRFGLVDTHSNSMVRSPGSATRIEVRVEKLGMTTWFRVRFVTVGYWEEEGSRWSSVRTQNMNLVPSTRRSVRLGRCRRILNRPSSKLPIVRVRYLVYGPNEHRGDPRRAANIAEARPGLQEEYS